MIHIEDVHKVYALGDARVNALSGVCLDVDPGEILFLGGASGSGKSTLLHLIGCLDRPTAGRVLVAGMDVATPDDDALANFRCRNLGFVFQDYSLLPVLTVRENVEYPLLLTGERHRKERVLGALGRVGLADFAHHYPNELSGGQRQRVAIARALVHSPRLLIADEPTANLDSRTGGEVIDLMLSLSHENGTTVVICTHNDTLLEAASRVVLLCDGRIVSDRVRAASR
jgi:putative ABC transport system ATP-binding protein